MNILYMHILMQNLPFIRNICYKTRNFMERSNELVAILIIIVFVRFMIIRFMIDSFMIVSFMIVSFMTVSIMKKA